MAVRSGDMPQYRGHGAIGYNRSPTVSHSPSLPVHDPQSQGSVGRIGHAWKDHKNGVPFKISLFVRRYFMSQTRMTIPIVTVLLATGFLCFLGASPAPSRSRFSYHPRVVVLTEFHQVLSIPQPLETSSRISSFNVVSPRLALDDNQENSHPAVEPETGASNKPIVFDDEETGCPFIANWQKQTAAKPTCNIQHEIGIQLGDPGLLHRLEPIDSGGFKDVWRVLLEDSKPLNAVLKTTLFEHDITPKNLNKYRRDALVMEETTSSPYVLNMYCYCAYSSVVESAEGTLRDWLHSMQEDEEIPIAIPSISLLRVAAKLAKGVADMHLFENGMATFAHVDVKVSQFLMVKDGKDFTFKINDFNRGRFLTSENAPEICPFHMSGKHKGSTCRSPEEYASHGDLTDKVDVYSFGAVLYYLLTLKSPFEDMKYKVAVEKIKAGVELPLPTSIKNSKDPGIVAILSTMKECLQFRSQDRPNSIEIFEKLLKAIREISEKQGESPLN